MILCCTTCTQKTVQKTNRSIHVHYKPSAFCFFLGGFFTAPAPSNCSLGLFLAVLVICVWAYKKGLHDCTGLKYCSPSNPYILKHAEIKLTLLFASFLLGAIRGVCTL